MRPGPFAQPQTPDLNEGLPAGTISSSAKQPLAFNMSLLTSASNHAQHMLQANTWGHFEGLIDVGNCWTGNTPSDRAAHAGYSGGVAENTAVAVSTANWTTDAARRGQAEARHNNLFVDGNVAGRGHRISSLNPNYNEVGIGFYFDTNYQGPFSSNWSYVNMVNYDFGTAAAPQLTGVLFDDKDGDSFYTPDGTEFLGGVVLNLVDSSGNIVRTTTSFTGSGGYNIDISGLAAGVYTLMAEGLPDGLSALDCGSACSITVPSGGATANMGLSAIASVPEPSAFLLLGVLVAPLGVFQALRSKRSP